LEESVSEKKGISLTKKRGADLRCGRMSSRQKFGRAGEEGEGHEAEKENITPHNGREG